jgi:hypothetical protein
MGTQIESMEKFNTIKYIKIENWKNRIIIWEKIILRHKYAPCTKKNI